MITRSPGVAEQLLGLAPATGRYAQRHVAAAEAVERPVRGEHALDARFREVPAPGARALEILEVAHHAPAVEARVADVDARLARAAFAAAQHAGEASTRGRRPPA